ncbi:Coenzyme PQQ synthesis protein D [Nitrospira sp. KM1]|uniref:pyrroloquinoline quinone biosynthesis peptide chaperone PqqD n=1 Tax=Nitrospira sp. KM1 TaxID=1936990 RepID=UPI0013A79CB2|nr:pyrroloquinoline quinone biosynthesis peptide chaperone PqqD [Nitrospira sp. KM1]BCA55255.1 Coenzyme PQQ synthesis protein D [Nitrospira sp. KM1]
MAGMTLRPRLSPKARLRRDRQTGRDWLLYPERGLDLNRTGSEILRLCNGNRTVDDIVALLAHGHGDALRETINRDVHAFLIGLTNRGLLRGAS